SSGYAESVVRPEGDDRILVELPGVNLEQAKQILGKTSYLTIYEWVPGTPDAKTLAELNPTDANKYQGFKPQFTNIDGSMITSAFTPASAQALAIQLNSGALPGSINLVSSTEVGATLGASTVKLSLLAGAFGLAIVILFMLLYYRLPGVVASLALLLYAAI